MIDTDANFVVVCPVGYCFSGGTCRMVGNTAICDCPAGFTGQRCENVVTTTTTAAPGTT